MPASASEPAEERRAQEGSDPPAPPEPIQLGISPGTRIADKYVVERLIGEGGLGIVVAARHVHLDQTVAIKFLRPNALEIKGVAERFLREARLAAKIRSDHVAHVYDVGTMPDGAPYMVMEYLEGTDLGHQLHRNGPLPVFQAVDYLIQACEALAEAHVVGIVHRDIKPDNLFIATAPGGKSVLKIVDFGISKMSTRKLPVSNELTEPGDKFGTPVYMSPEQLLSARDVDARTDVWAIGVVFYELLTGKLPFDGDLPELCAAILGKEPTPLLEARQNLPEQLQLVIDRCLAKNLDDRFQNVAELAQELRAFAGPVSQVGIDRVVQLIRGAGESVRPATPPPPATLEPVRAASVPPPLPSGTTRTTDSGISSWGSSAVAKVRSSGRARVLVLVGASLVAAALALTAIFDGRTPTAPAAQASSTVLSLEPSTPVSLTAPPATEAAPSPTTPTAKQDPGVEPAPTVSLPSAGTHKPSRPASSARPRSSAAAPASSAAPASPAAPDPNAVIDPFE